MLLAPDLLELPTVVPLEEPDVFTRFELDGLIRHGLARKSSASPGLHRILSRITNLRGEHLTWVFGLPLSRLAPCRARHLASDPHFAIAPLTIFKAKAGQWIPKIVIHVVDEFDIDRGALIACHAACRSFGIECLCLTEDHVAGNYLDGKEFKRAFNAAFFCDPAQSNIIFCPTLRDLGLTTWPKTHRQTRTFYQ